MFAKLIKTIQVRKNVFCYVYASHIEIDGIAFIGYSIKNAIKKYRKDYPLK